MLLIPLISTSAFTFLPELETVMEDQFKWKKRLLCRNHRIAFIIPLLVVSQGIAALHTNKTFINQTAFESDRQVGTCRLKIDSTVFKLDSQSPSSKNEKGKSCFGSGVLPHWINIKPYLWDRVVYTPQCYWCLLYGTKPCNMDQDGRPRCVLS